jgi:hypothetical protein
MRTETLQDGTSMREAKPCKTERRLRTETLQDGTLLAWLKLWDGLTRDAWVNGGLSLRRKRETFFLFCIHAWERDTEVSR